MTESDSYKQPREGITGTLREGDDLLSLEESAIAVRKTMTGLAGVLLRTTMVGQPAPVVTRISERMRSPQPGDLVMETSTMYRRADDWYRGFGVLIEHREEWWTTDAEWEQELAEERAAWEKFTRPGEGPFTPDPRTTDHAWYIQYGPQPGDICRWVNCEFIAIPVDPRFADITVGTREGSAVVFTRDDLIGGLADSGFHLREPPR